jgi:hypothetical protein
MASILKVNTIQDATNSNTSMTIDTSGRILTPARPAFRARIAGSTTGTGVNGVIVFETEDFDIGSNYDHTNGTFTAPIAGLYQFVFKCLIATNSSGSAMAGGDVFYADLQVNGSTVGGGRCYHYIGSGAHQNQVHLNELQQLSANDTVRINCLSEHVYSAAAGEYDPVFIGLLVG